MAFQDIRKSRKLLSAADVAFILGALILLVALLALNIYLARTLDGGEWLFQRWNGARAFLFEHIEPYGSVVAQHVQILVYDGREAFLNEYPYALSDPFYIVLLYTPLAALKELVSLFSSTLALSLDFSVVRGIWMLFSEIALVGIVMLSLRLSDWQPPRWMFVILVGFGLFSYFSINSLLSASPTIFLTLIYLLILSALRSFSDELAGALLFLVAYQWEVGALFFLFVLIFVILNRRWGVLSGFGMALIFSAIISLLVNKDWVIPYIRAVLFDWYRGINYTFGVALTYIFPNVSISINRWLAIIGGIIILLEAIHSADEHVRHVMWVAFLSLALNPMLGFAIFPSNHIAMLPAIILITALVWERWTNQPIMVGIFLTGLVLFFYLGFYVDAINTSTHIYAELLRILPPCLTVLGLYWMRWWAVRPPRVWADQIGPHK